MPSEKQQSPPPNDFGWQAFERHLAAQTRVFGPVHHAHAARAQGVKQLVMGDCRAEHYLPERTGYTTGGSAM